MEESRIAVAPGAHTHAHDVGALGLWMDTVKMTVESDIAARKDDNSSITSSNATKLFGAEAAREADELYKRGKKFTVFHNELARQTAAHCPRVARFGCACVCPLGARLRARAPKLCFVPILPQYTYIGICRMLVQVWSGMCALLEGAIERYEHQTRLSQQFHSKFLRLVTHSEDKLSRLSRENEELRAEIRELRAELSGKSSAVTALTREVGCRLPSRDEAALLLLL